MITFLTLAGIENSTTKRVLYIAKELQKRGHKVNFLSLNWISRKGSDCRGTTYFEGIKVKEIQIKNSFIGLFITGPLELIPHLKGLIFLSKPLPPHTIPFMMSRIFKKNKFILDVDDWEGIGGGASYSHFGWFKRTLISFLEEYVPIKAKGVIAASRVLERRAKDMGVKKVAYIPNVAEVPDVNINEKDKEDLIKELGIKKERVFLSSGSHSADMVVGGLKYFIEGFSKAKSKNFKLIITGQGKYTDSLKQLCDKLNLKNNIRFVGFVDEKKFNTCIAISHVAVVPHNSNYPYTLYALSSSPRKMYEALAHGLAILGCKTGEINETLGDCETLVPEGDVNEVGKKIDELINMSENKLKELSGKNKDKAEIEYNFKSQGDKVEEFLKTI